MAKTSKVVNKQKNCQLLAGINGVNPGANISITVPVNFRFHQLLLLCIGVNYTGGVAYTPTIIKSAAGVVGTATIKVNTNGYGLPTSLTIVAGSSAGFANGDTLTVQDVTGTGIIITAAGATLAAATITSTGTPSAYNPATFFTSFQQLPNGKNLRDVTAAQLLAISIANGYAPQIGELPLFYSEPWQIKAANPYITSWDMFGQSTFTIKAQISQNVTLPGIVGVMIFDGQRNGKLDKTQTPAVFTPGLKIVSMHAYSFNFVGGVNLINTLPITYPIRRIWIAGATPGNLTNLEIDQDGNKIWEIPVQQQNELLAQNGFTFNTPAANATTANSFTIPNGEVQSNIFDTAYITDLDGNLYHALSCASSLVLRVTSAIAQACTVVVEAIEGNYI